MAVYRFHIKSGVKFGKDYRYGEVRKVEYKKGGVIVGDEVEVKKAKKPRLKDDVDNLKKLVIDTLYIHPEETYPNFMQIRFSLYSADEKARAFLDTHTIPYKAVPIEIRNENAAFSYMSIFFQEVPDLINLEQSNLFVGEDGYVRTPGRDYFSPVESQLILRSSAEEIEGICSLSEGGGLLCSEIIKNELEMSDLTGFEFEKLEVV